MAEYLMTEAQKEAARRKKAEDEAKGEQKQKEAAVKLGEKTEDKAAPIPVRVPDTTETKLTSAQATARKKVIAKVRKEDEEPQPSREHHYGEAEEYDEVLLNPQSDTKPDGAI